MDNLNIKVTDFYNNGYNGGLTIEVTVGTFVKTYEVNGSTIVLDDRNLGCSLFSMTAGDDEFINYEDDEGRAEFVNMGWIEEAKDDWDDDILTVAGEAAKKEGHLDMLQDFVQEYQEDVNAYIHEMVSKDEDYLKTLLKPQVLTGKDFTWSLHFAETLGCECESDGEAPYISFTDHDNWMEDKVLAVVTEAVCKDEAEGIWELTLEGFKDRAPYKRVWVLNQEMAVVEPW